MKNIRLFIAAALIAMMISSNGNGRELFEGGPSKLFKVDGEFPYLTIAVHNVGKMAITVTNFGVIGTAGYNIADPTTGLAAPSLSYPQGYGLNYLSSASIWIGAVAGHDSLVSTGNNFGWGDINEFLPLPYPAGRIEYRSTNP